MSLARAIAIEALLLVAQATLAADAADAVAPPPLPWREPAPIARLFLQLPFDAPEVMAPHAFTVRLDLLYSNSLLLASNLDLALDVHVETAQPTLLLRYGLAPGVEAELGIPFVTDYAGFLDGPIDTVEAWFKASNYQRRMVPRHTSRFQLTRPDNSGIYDGRSGAGLGDVWTGLKVSLPVPFEGVQVALRGAVKLPTGRLPFGSEELDLGASLLASWSWRHTAVRLALDFVAPTGELADIHLPTRPYGALQLGVVQRLWDRVALMVQASGHLSPLGGTGLDRLDSPTAYLLVGVDFALSRSVHLDAGVVENIFSPYRGADITFPLGLRASF